MGQNGAFSMLKNTPAQKKYTIAGRGGWDFVHLEIRIHKTEQKKGRKM